MLTSDGIRTKCTKKRYCATLVSSLDNRSERSNGFDHSALMNFRTGKTRDCVVHRERGGKSRLVKFCPYCGTKLV